MINKLFAVTNYTFKEIIKSKIMFVTLLIGLFIMLVTYVATEFSYGAPEKVALDFGLGMLSLSSLGISLFLGANLLPKEIDSRTVYMVISRPVPRWVFIIGKILGLTMILILNIILLATMTLICSSWMGGEINSLIFLSIFFTMLESIMLLLLVVFMSLLTSPLLSTVVSLTIWLLGHGIKETQNTLFVENRPYFKVILEFYHLVLPGFYKLNLKDFIVYNQTLPFSYISSSLLYGICYSLFLFLMIIYLFNKKNLD